MAAASLLFPFELCAAVCRLDVIINMVGSFKYGYKDIDNASWEDEQL